MPPRKPEPRRLRAVDELDRLQAIIETLATRTAEPYVTVEHTLNAKGDTQTSVKVSAPFGCDLDALAEYAEGVEALASVTYEAATARRPRV